MYLTSPESSSSPESVRTERGRREGRVVVKPGLQGSVRSAQRRFLLLDPLYDDQSDVIPRCVRCVEMRVAGDGGQFLMLRSRRQTAEDGQKDLHMLSQLQHPHVLGYRDAWHCGDVQYVLCDNARLFLSVCLRAMAAEGEGGGGGSQGEGGPSPELYPRWLFHIASALEYLHEQHDADRPMLHRAVQPDNILITDRCVLKLCAFHTAKRLEPTQRSTQTRVGGGLFRSPEMTGRKSYDQSVDIWAFGVTAAHIASYIRAGKAGSAEKLVTLVERSGQAPQTVRVVREALRERPEDRPRASQIVRDLAMAFGTSWLQSPPPAHAHPAPLVRELNRPSPLSHPDPPPSGPPLPPPSPPSAPTRQPRQQNGIPTQPTPTSTPQRKDSKRGSSRPSSTIPQNTSTRPQRAPTERDSISTEPSNFSNGQTTADNMKDPSSRFRRTDVQTHERPLPQYEVLSTAEVGSVSAQVDMKAVAQADTETQTSFYGPEPGRTSVQTTSTQTSLISPRHRDPGEDRTWGEDGTRRPEDPFPRSTSTPAGSFSRDPPGGSFSRDPPGGSFSRDPPGGSFSRDPSGVSFSRDPPGGSFYRDPPGGSFSRDPPGGSSDGKASPCPSDSSQKGSSILLNSFEKFRILLEEVHINYRDKSTTDDSTPDLTPDPSPHPHHPHPALGPKWVLSTSPLHPKPAPRASVPGDMAHTAPAKSSNISSDELEESVSAKRSARRERRSQFRRDHPVFSDQQQDIVINDSHRHPGDKHSGPSLHINVHPRNKNDNEEESSSAEPPGHNRGKARTPLSNKSPQKPRNDRARSPSGANDAQPQNSPPGQKARDGSETSTRTTPHRHRRFNDPPAEDSDSSRRTVPEPVPRSRRGPSTPSPGTNPFDPEVLQKIDARTREYLRTKREEQPRPKRKTSRSRQRHEQDTGQGDSDRGHHCRGQGQGGRGQGERDDGGPADFDGQSDEWETASRHRTRTDSRGGGWRRRGEEEENPHLGTNNPPSPRQPSSRPLPQPSQSRARRVPTPRPQPPDLPVETDGTSGLGDSFHSQDLTDC